MATTLSVVVPTIGRASQLRACLESIARTDLALDDVVVVDQSDDSAVEQLVAALGDASMRRVASAGRSVGSAINDGLRAARHDAVLVTHDDCTVAGDWASTAAGLPLDERRIVTGRVLALGDPKAVPSTIDEPTPRVYASARHWGVLFPNNMLLRRSAVLALGGFDEQIPFAEDNDFCYRWLRSGSTIAYEPRLTVWHHEWRSPGEMRQLYVDYAYGSGFVYGKHLRRGDPRLLGRLAADLRAGVRARIAAAFAGERPWWDWRQGILDGLPRGVVAGWRHEHRRRRA